jgi:Tfp pilus assembly protein PilO
MQIKNRQQVLAIAAAVVLGLLVLDSLVVEPLIKSWKGRSDKIVELQKKLTRNTALLKRELQSNSQWDDMRTNMLQGDSSQASSQLVKAFDRWSQASGISVTGIKPQWKQSEDDYATVECQVDASGTMASVARFLHEIEKDPMGVKIESTGITSHDLDGQKITLALQVSGVVLLPKQ